MARTPKKFILQYQSAPGDTLVLTALVRDIKLRYGDDVLVDVRSYFTDSIWLHNPYLTSLADSDRDAQKVQLSERAYITQSRNGVRQHYLTAYFRDFTAKTGLPVTLTKPHGDIHLTEQERTRPIIAGDYLVIVPGGKLDITVKFWPTEYYQEVVRLGMERGWQFVQEGAAKPRHVHPPLTDALSMVGKTNIRDLFVNIYHSHGVVCGISLPMHIAGALHKPCVVLAGGREDPHWEQYANLFPEQFGGACEPVRVPHTYLNTMGQLSCCERSGCWRQRIVRLYDGVEKNEKSLCDYPESVGAQPVARCMKMLKPQMVVDALATYALPSVWTPPSVVRMPAQIAVGKETPQAVQQKRTEADEPEVAPVAEMTCCILMHGRQRHEFEMHKRCLDSIRASTPAGALEFRIGCNQVGVDTLGYLQELREALPSTRLYVDEHSRRKYPAMREMFHDPVAPITTPWVLWFDDDTYVIDASWYKRLRLLQRDCDADVGCFGIPLFSRIQRSYQLQWFRDAPWYRQRQFRTAHGSCAPNGNCVHFPVGWFWCARTSALLACDIPCKRLNHNGGDVTIGEQLHQGGYRTVAFNVGKCHIFTPPKSRRGYVESPPWLLPEPGQ